MFKESKDEDLIENIEFSKQAAYEGNYCANNVPKFSYLIPFYI